MNTLNATLSSLSPLQPPTLAQTSKPATQPRTACLAACPGLWSCSVLSCLVSMARLRKKKEAFSDRRPQCYAGVEAKSGSQLQGNLCDNLPSNWPAIGAQRNTPAPTDSKQSLYPSGSRLVAKPGAPIVCVLSGQRAYPVRCESDRSVKRPPGNTTSRLAQVGRPNHQTATL